MSDLKKLLFLKFLLARTLFNNKARVISFKLLPALDVHFAQGHGAEGIDEC